ncbi:MAG: MTH938/NDUFAF3 family protein [bacterium]|nr:MTH938/NDUFAF3 family protein [bacterium]
MIEEYSFGFIKINGQVYNHDVQIDLDGKVRLWWRNKSHEIGRREIEEVLGQKPEAIVIGTGEMGAAKAMDEAQQAITSKGIKLVIEPTAEAVKSFNSLGKDKKVAGLFHLTC